MRPRPVRRYRYEYRQKKKRMELERALEQARRKEAGWRGVVKELAGWVLYVAIIVGLTFLIVTYVGQRTKVSGASMEATLQNGDNLLVDKISYRFREPKRFEIIVFEHGTDHYIKRIIGLPGETVQIVGNQIFIEGELIEENFSRDGEMGSAGIAANPITLGEGEYFVLGDNRLHSHDSRAFSSVDERVTKDLIVGRAWIRLWPFETIGVISHE